MKIIVKVIKTETHVLKNSEGETVFEEKNGRKFTVYKDGAEELEEKVNEFLENLLQKEDSAIVVDKIQFQTGSGGDQDPWIEYLAMITYKVFR